jgi:hypothetical protein
MVQVRLKPPTYFYATASEMAEWVVSWIARWGLHAVLGGGSSPYNLTTLVNWQDKVAVYGIFQTHRLLYLRHEPFTLDGVTSINQVPELNDNILDIVLPERTPRGLLYGSIGSISRDRSVQVNWRTATKDILERTTPGVVYGIPGREYRVTEPEVRVSSEAVSLWGQGIPLLGGGQTVVVELADTQAKPTEG